MPSTSNLSYTELTLHQLRCLCETARLGSFVGAAGALKTSHPTVWKQVHALERDFGIQLVEPHARGCFLTAAGKQLVEMAGPAVEQIGRLRERFQAALEAVGSHLTIAVTPRTLVEDLAPCVPKFLRLAPRTQFTFVELPNEEVAQAVVSRQADFGVSPQPLTKAQAEVLLTEPAYSLEVRLITAPDHPLVKRRTVRPRDLRAYPLLNAPNTGSFMWNALAKHRAYLEKAHTVHAGLAASIHRFVELGVGIGLIPAVPSAPPHPRVHERSMRRYFGPIQVMLLRRRGAFMSSAAELFVNLVRSELNAQATARMHK